MINDIRDIGTKIASIQLDCTVPTSGFCISQETRKQALDEVNTRIQTLCAKIVGYDPQLQIRWEIFGKQSMVFAQVAPLFKKTLEIARENQYKNSKVSLLNACLQLVFEQPNGNEPHIQNIKEEWEFRLEARRKRHPRSLEGLVAKISKPLMSEVSRLEERFSQTLNRSKDQWGIAYSLKASLRADKYGDIGLALLKSTDTQFLKSIVLIHSILENSDWLIPMEAELSRSIKKLTLWDEPSTMFHPSPELVRLLEQKFIGKEPVLLTEEEEALFTLLQKTVSSIDMPAPVENLYRSMLCMDFECRIDDLFVSDGPSSKSFFEAIDTVLGEIDYLSKPDHNQACTRLFSNLSKKVKENPEILADFSYGPKLGQLLVRKLPFTREPQNAAAAKLQFLQVLSLAANNPVKAFGVLKKMLDFTKRMGRIALVPAEELLKLPEKIGDSQKQQIHIVLIPELVRIKNEVEAKKLAGLVYIQMSLKAHNRDITLYQRFLQSLSDANAIFWQSLPKETQPNDTNCFFVSKCLATAQLYTEQFPEFASEYLFSLSASFNDPSHVLQTHFSQKVAKATFDAIVEIKLIEKRAQYLITLFRNLGNRLPGTLMIEARQYLAAALAIMPHNWTWSFSLSSAGYGILGDTPKMIDFAQKALASIPKGEGQNASDIWLLRNLRNDLLPSIKYIQDEQAQWTCVNLVIDSMRAEKKTEDRISALMNIRSELDRHGYEKNRLYGNIFILAIRRALEEIASIKDEERAIQFYISLLPFSSDMDLPYILGKLRDLVSGVGDVQKREGYRDLIASHLPFNKKQKISEAVENKLP